MNAGLSKKIYILHGMTYSRAIMKIRKQTKRDLPPRPSRFVMTEGLEPIVVRFDQEARQETAAQIDDEIPPLPKT